MAAVLALTLPALFPAKRTEEHPPCERLVTLVLLPTLPALLPTKRLEKHSPRERLLPLVLLPTLPALLPMKRQEKHPPCVPLVLLLSLAAAHPGTHCLSCVVREVPRRRACSPVTGHCICCVLSGLLGWLNQGCGNIYSSIL